MPRLLVTMLLAVLLLLSLPDPPSAQGYPLYMRLPPSTLQGEPGWSEGAAKEGGAERKWVPGRGTGVYHLHSQGPLASSAHAARRRGQEHRLGEGGDEDGRRWGASQGCIRARASPWFSGPKGG